MEYDIPKIIEFLELFKEIAKPANSMYRWEQLISVIPVVEISSYKVTEPMGFEVESINFIINREWKHQLMIKEEHGTH